MLVLCSWLNDVSCCFHRPAVPPVVFVLMFAVVKKIVAFQIHFKDDNNKDCCVIVFVTRRSLPAAGRRFWNKYAHVSYIYPDMLYEMFMACFYLFERGCRPRCHAPRYRCKCVTSTGLWSVQSKHFKTLMLASQSRSRSSTETSNSVPSGDKKRRHVEALGVASIYGIRDAVFTCENNHTVVTQVFVVTDRVPTPKHPARSGMCKDKCPPPHPF